MPFDYENIGKHKENKQNLGEKVEGNRQGIEVVDITNKDAAYDIYVSNLDPSLSIKILND